MILFQNRFSGKIKQNENLVGICHKDTALTICWTCLLFVTLKHAVSLERNGAGDNQCLALCFWIAIEGQYPTGCVFINRLSNEMSCTFIGMVLFASSSCWNRGAACRWRKFASLLSLSAVVKRSRHMHTHIYTRVIPELTKKHNWLLNASEFSLEWFSNNCQT